MEDVIGRFLDKIRKQQQLGVGQASAEQMESSVGGNLLAIHSADPIVCSWILDARESIRKAASVGWIFQSSERKEIQLVITIFTLRCTYIALLFIL
jgi:DNA polymerase III delta subunit